MLNIWQENSLNSLVKSEKISEWGRIRGEIWKLRKHWERAEAIIWSKSTFYREATSSLLLEYCWNNVLCKGKEVGQVLRNKCIFCFLDDWATQEFSMKELCVYSKNITLMAMLSIHCKIIRKETIHGINHSVWWDYGK